MSLTTSSTIKAVRAGSAKTSTGNTSTNTATTALERQCLEQGIRITAVRRIILGLLEQAKDPLTATEIYRRVCLENTTASMSTIYSNIKLLSDTGIITRRQFQSRQISYMTSSAESRDQLIDIKSGRVIQFHNEALDTLKAEIATQYGYSITDCHIEFYAYPLPTTKPGHNDD